MRYACSIAEPEVALSPVMRTCGVSRDPSAEVPLGAGPFERQSRSYLAFAKLWLHAEERYQESRSFVGDEMDWERKRERLFQRSECLS
jgi:hypothetical protein